MPIMFYGDDDDSDEQRYKFEMRGENELIIIGINPSTARGVSKNFSQWTDDQTIRKAKGFVTRSISALNKFNGFLMLNVCAQSAKKPEKLALVRDVVLHNKNLDKIKKYLEGKNGISVLLSYGDLIFERAYLKQNLREIIAELQKHAEWYKMLREKYPTVTEDKVSGILQAEIGEVFKTVLVHAGVYKRDAEGMAAFDKFMQAVSEDE